MIDDPAQFSGAFGDVADDLLRMAGDKFLNLVFQRLHFSRGEAYLVLPLDRPKQRTIKRLGSKIGGQEGDAIQCDSFAAATVFRR